MKQSQPKTLPWSWGRSLGWRGQLERMHRWMDRLNELTGTTRLDEILDFLLAFFIAAYHLRDWLLRENPNIRTDLDALFANSKSLRLCADIANVAKHYDLTQQPRARSQFSFAREHAGPNQGWFGTDARLTMLTPDHKEDVLDLAVKCEVDWTAFLSQQGLI